MNTLTFNEKQAAAMTAIACYEAKGDLMSLESAIHNGLEADLTANQIKEALPNFMPTQGFLDRSTRWVYFNALSETEKQKE